MKTWLKPLACIVAVLAAALASSHAVEAAAPAVVERGPHHATWQRVTERITPYGRKFYLTNSYQEIATGLNFWRDNQWLESREQIEIVQGAALARNGQHQAAFAANLNTPGAIELVQPDGKRFRSHILGLAYTDATGRSVLVAQVKDCTGVVLDPNQVYYEDAFDGECIADVRYTYTRAGFEQDLILVTAPPSPAAYGLDPETTRLELFTEFLEAPEPGIKEVTLRKAPNAAGDLTDQILDFGSMTIGTGHAFPMGEQDRFSGDSAPIGKEWRWIGQRLFLIEKADYDLVLPHLQKMPQAAQAQGQKRRQQLQAKNTLLAGLPGPAGLKKEWKRNATASIPPKRNGLVWDYQTINSSMTNYVFRSDSTYFLSASLSLFGTTVLEEGTCIKFTNGVDLMLAGPLDCRTTEFRPAYFTGRDDNSVGETISGSTGSPSGQYGRHSLGCNASPGPYDVHDIRVRYATYGVTVFTVAKKATISHVEIGNVDRGVAWQANTDVSCRNFLFYDVGNAFYGSSASSTNRAENGTIHRAPNFLNSTNYAPALSLTNCLLIAVTNNLKFNTGSNNETNQNDSGIFQTAGSGARYLASSSSYRNAGTTNINATLLADLRRRSTYPPLLLSNDVTTDTTLSPQAQRDTDAVDLGFHYSSVDWLISGTSGISVTGATLRVQGGATVAISAAVTNFGIRLQSGSALISDGDPVNLNRFVRTHSVQEIPSGSGASTAPLFADTYPGPSSPVTLNLRFTDVPQVQKHRAFSQGNGIGTFATVILRDSQFRGGQVYFSQSLSNQFMGMTNLLVEDSAWTFYPYTPTTLHLRNGTFKSGKLDLYVLAGSTWTVKDCLFDYTTVTNTGAGTLTNDYNGYLTNAARFTPTGASDIVLATNTVNFQVGPLGSYYLPAGSQLIDVGSINATNAQLYHYCTTTNQAPETNSIVDIGLHYVALNSLGQPEDSNVPTNGIPNYLDDPNGNGIVDGGETSYTTISIAVTSPTNGANFGEGANITLNANAAVPWNTITWVELYQGATSLGQDSTSPYGVAWNNVPPGIYTLTAVARANAGILATSAPVTIQVHSNNTLFIVGTNMTPTETDMRSRLETKGLYSLVRHDDDATSADANGKRLLVISRSTETNRIGTKFVTNAVPLLTWQEGVYGLFGLTTNSASYFGSLSSNQNGVLLPSHVIAGGLTGTNDVTTNNWSFGWGKPTTNAGRVTRLTAPGSTPDHVGIFAYESNAPMVGLKAPSRRAGFFLGAAPISDLTSNGIRLLDRTIDWVVNTNAPPLISWIAPTNGSVFIGSTNITLNADVSDNDSGLRRVSFYRNDVRIGLANTLTNNTYGLAWSNVPGGSFRLSTKAVDQGGVIATSSQFIAITVLSNVLFVTDSTSLNASDGAIKTHLENRGYIVTVRDDASATSADADGKSAVLISTTASAANVTNKFTKSITPVLVWNGSLFDDLGMTGTNVNDYGSMSTQSNLVISVAADPMAAGLSGTVAVATVSGNFTWAVPGSNAVTIATVTNNASKAVIFRYEKSKLMVGLGTNAFAAPGRRVGFFFGSDTAASLNANGWALFDSAFNWVVERPCFPKVDVMLVVDRSGSVAGQPFADLKAAGSNFMGNLRLNLDQVCLVSFAATSQVERVLTTNLPLVTSNLYALVTDPGTRLDYAINTGQIQLDSTNRSPDAIPVMILFSDGAQNPMDTSNAVLAAAADAKTKGTRLIAIRFAGGADEGLMQAIASPGDYYYAPDTSELTDIYNTVAETLCRQPPSVAITSPTNGTFFAIPPTNVTLSATATDSDGYISNLVFFVGSTPINLPIVTNGNSYSVSWWPLFGGTNVITARAVDNLGGTTISEPITFFVNNPPQVAITNPVNPAVAMTPNNTITIQASASDVEASGSVTQVEFFRDEVSLGAATTAPYSRTWTNAPPGTYVLAARATDNNGAARTSTGVTITVKPTNAPPVVDAGGTQVIRLPAVATLNGRATDDGLPPGSALQIWWSKVSGPGTVTFGNSNVAATTASFSAAGTYVLRLTANDSQFTVTNDITITNLTNNLAPIVNAGPDQTLVLAAQAPFASSTNALFEQFNPDSKGNEFWLAFPRNHHDGDPDSGPLSLTFFITSSRDSWVSVTIGGLNFATNVSLLANTISTIVIPPSAKIHQAYRTNDLGIHITASTEVAVYGLSRREHTTDGFLALPVDILGTNYVVLGYTNNESSQCAIVGTWKSTSISITPTTPTPFGASGEPFTITLDAGQTFMMEDFTDLSGSLIVSDKPIAVFGGNVCANVPWTNAWCDHLLEQLPPVSAWGKNFATLPLALRLKGDVFQVIAVEDNTTVKTNGVELTTLSSRELFHFVLETPTHITATKPVLLAQYSQSQSVDSVPSDPFMQLVPPYEQFLSSYVISTPASGFSNQFVNVVCPTGIVGQVKLDGTNLLASNFVTIANSGFAGAQVSITNGSHHLEGPLPFGLHVYGFDVADSYGYPGGMSLSAVANVNAIAISPNPGTNEINTTRCVFASATDVSGKPIPGVRVDFLVRGSNSVDGFALTEGSGTARFCYTGAITGSDVITASSGTVTNKATNYWMLPFIYMTGSASDDGLPAGTLSLAWSKTSGPGAVTFTPNTATNAQTTLTSPGIHVLRLTANDSELSVFDEMMLTVVRNQPPIVSAGQNRAMRGESTVLDGSATDDGLPTTTLSLAWSALNPPGTVTFSSTSQPQPTVTFSAPGVYPLRLTANDSEVAINSDVVITNQPDASLIVCTQTITGTLAATGRQAVGRPGTYADYYRFTAEAGQLLVIEMTSTNVDSFLSVFTEDLRLLATDDDSLQTNNAKLICMTPFAGEYYLEASSAFTNETGAYQVKLNCGAFPVVRISSPTNGTFWADPPGTFTVFIDAYDFDGIGMLELWDDSGWAGEDSSAPYEISYSIVDPGIYHLYARAQDGANNWATSSVVVLRVGTPRLNVTPASACPSVPGSSHSVTVTVTNAYGGPLVGTNVQFTVSGANSDSGSTNTDASGHASFMYSGVNSDFDKIKATAVIEGVTYESVGGKSWARPIACNQLRTGTLSTNDEVTLPYSRYADYYWFNAASNDAVEISLSSTNFDSYLTLYNSSCTLVATNDDFESSDSRISFTMTNAGMFLIEVTSFQPLQTGSYSLLLDCTAPAAQPEIAMFLGPTEVLNYGLIEFGMTTNGTPIYKVLTITNRGDGDLLIDGISPYGDFSTTNALTFVVPPAGSKDFTIRFNAATNGSHLSFIAFHNDDGDGGDGLERPFIINLTAVCNTGSPPTVTLTAPANNTVLQLPTNVLVSATASSSVSTVTNVEFVARKGDRLYLIGSDSSSPYEMTYYPSAGSYVLTAVARDAQGRIGVSAGINLEVKAASTNALPVARQDYVSVLANSTYNVLSPLDNDTDPEGDPLTITSVTNLHGGFAAVINNGQNVLYIPPFGIRGGDYFEYTIKDSKGGQASSVVNVAIDATDPPKVSIVTPPQNATVTAGTATNILAAVTPANFQGKVEFFFHDHKIGEATSSPYVVSWIPIEDPCNCGLTAIATDVFGQIATSDRVSVTITPPSNDAAPKARIANLTNEIVSIPGHTYTRAATIREGLFELFGDAYDTDSSPVWYKVRIFSSERELVRDVTPPPLNGDGFHVGAVNNASLGVLDLSLVANGAYDLELTVRAGYRQSSTNVHFALESDLKIGQFSFSEQDLVLPVNGFPLTITRTYNSLNLKDGDFGRCWTYSFSDLQLELDEDRALVESLFEDEGEESVEPSGQFFSLRVGGERNVTLTLPDGRRTTFYYYLQPASCDTSEFQFCAIPKWFAAPGVFASLRTVNDVKLAVLPWSGGMQWWTDNASSAVENYEFPGYILTMPDGTEYRIDRELVGEKTFVSGGIGGNYAKLYGPGRLTEIKSRSNDKIVIGTNRIDHLNPSGQLTRSIWLQRDAENRIVAINDPISGSNGVPVVKYDYAGENLVRVHRLVDRATSNYLTTTYTYTNRAYPHYITGITDPRGIQVARNLYDDAGRLIGIINSDGLTNSFVHNLSNRWEIALNAKGYGTTNVFDSRGNITNRIDALGRTNHFRYDTNGYMLAHIDPLGNTTTYSNDARGNVLEVTLPYASGADPTKYTSRYIYDTNDNQTSIVLPTGGVITNKFDAAGNLLETRDGAGNIISTNAYDANGFMIAEGDQFGALHFGHDSSGNATRMTNSLNQVITSGYNANGDITNLVDNGVTSSFSYDAQGRDAFANYGNGITLSNGYNSQMDWNSVDGPTIGHMERRFDNQGRLSGWTTVSGAQPGFAYNEVGQMEYETNSIGVVTRQVYDLAGRLISVTNLTTGASMGYGYDAAGHRIAETNALGQFTRFDYNPDGSLKAMTNAFGTNVWTYAYDTGGGCCGGAGGTTTTVTDPLGREVTDVRSLLGLPVQLITRLGTNAVTNTTVYLSGIVSSDQEGEEYPASVTDEGGRTRNFGYTALGQLERASDLSGTTFWTNRYSSVDGTLLEIISPTGETNSFVYDDLDNVKTNRFSDGNLLINYYTAENRLASNALPSGASLHLKYDSAGRITNRISSIGESATFSYNGNDAVAMMTDNTGTTTNLYDAAGRLIGINYPSGATIRYELDKLSRITAITNRASGEGIPYATRYAYDAVGNITNVTDPFGGQTSLEYDRAGRRTKRTLPNGITTDWHYNWRDQVTNIVHKNSGSTVLASVAYERAPFGEPTKITREDGTYVLLRYDAALRLTNEQHYASGGSPIESIGYGYDASGTRTRLSNNSGTFTNSVQPGYRVTGVKNQSSGSTVETYNYDAGGRITSMTRSSATLNLGYNTADQLTAVTNGANWTQYTHDAQGRRVKSVDESGAQRRFLVAGTPASDLESPHLIADSNNNLKQGYVYFGDQPILRFDSSGSSSRVYYLEDGMGSIIGLAPEGSPATGNTTRLFYDGFGNTRTTNGPAPTIPSGTGGDFRFHRLWLEEANSLYHARARDYDSRTGHFTSRDPDGGSTETPEGLHPYNYAHCNAYIYSDPTGEFTMVEMNVVTFLQFTLQTLRTALVNEAKHWAIGKIGDAFGGALLDRMEAFIPNFQWSRFSQYIRSNPLGTGNAFDRAVKIAICKSIGSLEGVGDKIHMDVRVVNKGIRLGQPISAGNHCGSGFAPFDPNTPVLGQTKGAKYSIPDMIIGPAPLVPPGGRRGTQKTYLVAEVKSQASSLYSAYVRPARNKKQLQAILGYSVRNTETRIAFFVIAKNDFKRGLANNARFYMMKRIIGFHALSHGVLPVLVKVR